MNRQTVLEELCRSVVEMNKEMGYKAIDEAKELGMNEVDLIENGLIKGIKQLSLYYKMGEAQMSDVLIATDVMEKIVGKIFSENTLNELYKKRGIIMLFSAEEDCHNMGRYIMERMLNSLSYKVYNIDDSTDPEKMIEIAEILHVDVMVGSVIMNSSVSYMQKISEILKEKESAISLVCGGSDDIVDLLKSAGIPYVSCNINETLETIKKLI